MARCYFGTLSAMTFVLGMLVCSGCATKVAECNKLIAATNANSDAVTKAANDVEAAKQSPKSLDDFAKTLDKAAQDLTAVSLKDAKLREVAGEYNDMLKGLSGAAQALKGNDPAKQQKAVSVFAAADATEAALLKKLNTYCHQ